MPVAYSPALDVADDPAYDPTDKLFVPSASNPVLLVWDTFTEAVNTALTSHTPDVDNTSLGWSEVGSGGTVIASTDELNAATTADNYGYITNTLSPHISRVGFQAATRDRVCIGVRLTDASNYFYVNADISGGSMLLFEKVAGVGNTRALVTGLTITNADTLWVSDDGSTIKAGLSGGAPEISFATTALNSSKNMGIVANGSSSAAVGATSFLVYTGTTDPADLVEP